LVPVHVTNWYQRSLACTPLGANVEAPLIPVCNEPVLKRGAFCPESLVPVCFPVQKGL
jgi:hypothetical protein